MRGSVTRRDEGERLVLGSAVNRVVFGGADTDGGGVQVVLPAQAIDERDQLGRAALAVDGRLDPVAGRHVALEHDPVVDHLRRALEAVFGNTRGELCEATGSNVFVVVDGVLVVDTGDGQARADVLAAIRRLSDRPIRWIVNTHAHADHTGGNETVSRAGTYVRLIDSFDPRGQRSEAGIVARGGEVYRLPAQGGRLLERLAPLHDWAEGWARRR